MDSWDERVFPPDDLFIDEDLLSPKLSRAREINSKLITTNHILNLQEKGLKLPTDYADVWGQLQMSPYELDDDEMITGIEKAGKFEIPTPSSSGLTLDIAVTEEPQIQSLLEMNEILMSQTIGASGIWIAPTFEWQPNYPPLVKSILASQPNEIHRYEEWSFSIYAFDLFSDPPWSFNPALVIDLGKNRMNQSVRKAPKKDSEISISDATGVEFIVSDEDIRLMQKYQRNKNEKYAEFLDLIKNAAESSGVFSDSYFHQKICSEQHMKWLKDPLETSDRHIYQGLESLHPSFFNNEWLEARSKAFQGLNPISNEYYNS